MDAAAFSLAARLLSERLAAIPDLLGAGVTRARLVCDALSADAPPLLELPLLTGGSAWIAYAVSFAAPCLWLDDNTCAASALLASDAARGDAGGEGLASLPAVSRARHPATGAPSLVLHTCGAHALLREAAGAADAPAGAGAGAPALRAYAALLSWAPQALAQAGLQQNADACLTELARVRQATARAAL
jgi:hypothetical protein